MANKNALALVFLVGCVMVACSLKIKTAPIKAPPLNPLSALNFERHQKGIHTLAFGNEPFWAIEIAADSLFYSTPDFRFPLGFEVVRTTSDFVYAQREGVAVSVFLHMGACSDQMMNGKHPFATTVYWMPVDADVVLLEGCGRPLYNPHLHGHWALQPAGAQAANVLLSFDVPNGLAYIQQNDIVDTLYFENQGTALVFKPRLSFPKTKLALQLQAATHFEIQHKQVLNLLHAGEVVFIGNRLLLAKAPH